GTVARIQRADVLDEPRIAKSRIDRPVFLVVIHPRYRAHRAADQLAIGCDGILPNLGQVLTLELVLEDDPVLPGLLERQAEDFAEVVRVIARASIVAPKPRNNFFGRIGVREVSGESRAVEIRI